MSGDSGKPERCSGIGPKLFGFIPESVSDHPTTFERFIHALIAGSAAEIACRLVSAFHLIQ